MKLAKYIIVEKLGLEIAIILHAGISHDEAVNPYELTLHGSILKSAGYCCFEEGRVEVCQGMPSTSLHLHPRPQDAEILENTFHLMGLKLKAPESAVQSARFETPATSQP